MNKKLNKKVQINKNNNKKKKLTKSKKKVHCLSMKSLILIWLKAMNLRLSILGKVLQFKVVIKTGDFNQVNLNIMQRFKILQ
jgi:hypothetical protein